jgi:hypothetical protein
LLDKERITTTTFLVNHLPQEAAFVFIFETTFGQPMPINSWKAVWKIAMSIVADLLWIGKDHTTHYLKALMTINSNIDEG